jgi:amino-acid N-acetyltransferase
MHVDPFLIEPLRPHERPRLHDLLQTCDLPVDDLQWSPVDFLVMREAGQVVGAVGLESADGVGLLRSLAVLPSLHGQGRGAALVVAAERLAEQRGIDDLYLLTTTAPGFFALHDYLRVQRSSVPYALQRTAQFASVCPTSAVCMHKRLRRRTDGGAIS